MLASDANVYPGDLEGSRHDGTMRIFSNSGGSNYAFGNGSVRVIRFGEALCPLNLNTAVA